VDRSVVHSLLRHGPTRSSLYPRFDHALRGESPSERQGGRQGGEVDRGLRLPAAARGGPGRGDRGRAHPLAGGEAAGAGAGAGPSGRELVRGGGVGVPAHGQSGARGEHLGSGLSALELARPSDDGFDLDLTGFDEEEPGRMPAGGGAVGGGDPAGGGRRRARRAEARDGRRSLPAHGQAGQGKGDGPGDGRGDAGSRRPGRTAARAPRGCRSDPWSRPGLDRSRPFFSLTFPNRAMPRQSVEARSAVGRRSRPRKSVPQPPENLSPEARKLWARIIASKPADWFDESNLPILAQYCDLVVERPIWSCAGTSSTR
jgi:hypothetical protein